VSWNAPFKAKIREQYDDWMMHGDKSFTAGGNPRAPPMTIYLNWILTAWNAISNEIIMKSFVACGIPSALDGSEDAGIHCFKANGSVPTGFALLQQARAIQQENTLLELLENVDLDQDEENGYLSDESLVES
jgi:hypothetical protein